MKKIKFSHDYQKLRNIKSNYATLLAVFNTKKGEMSADFTNYDTLYSAGYLIFKNYKLPSGPLLVLLFISDDGHLFTTIRPNTKYRYDKEAYYRGAIGERFEIVVEEEKCQQK